MSLLTAWLAIVSDWRSAFPQQRTFRRAVRQGLGSLVCLGRLGSRALPIRFEEVSAVKRPRRRAPEVEWENYRAALKQHRLSQRFVLMARRVRAAFDALGGAGRIVVLAADGSFCNRTVFTQPVAGVELIARARKDAQLCFAAPAGSRRFYGRDKFTPEQVRQDPQRGWQTAKVFYGGERRQIRYKEVRAVLWQGGARRRLLRLLVLAPTPYRKRKSGRLYYRQPAYLPPIAPCCWLPFRRLGLNGAKPTHRCPGGDATPIDPPASTW